MPGPYPSPFGKRAGDGDTRSSSADPRARDLVNRGPAAWPTFMGNHDGELRRQAKGQLPRGADEITGSTWGRPDHLRTPYPHAGDRCQFVREEWGDPEPAVIVQVQDPNDDDPNLHFNRGQDPMPWVILQTDDGFVTKTREARVRGAAGWLPLP